MGLPICAEVERIKDIVEIYWHYSNGKELVAAFIKRSHAESLGLKRPISIDIIEKCFLLPIPLDDPQVGCVYMHEFVM